MDINTQDNYPVRSILESPEVKDMFSDQDVASHPSLGPNPEEPEVVRAAREALALRFGEGGYWLYFACRPARERLLVSGLSFSAEGLDNFQNIVNYEGPIKPLNVIRKVITITH